MIGSTVWANRSASSIDIFRPLAAASAVLVGLPSFMPVVLREARAALVRSEIRRRSFSASAAIEVQHERIGIGTELGDDERNPLRHQPGNEGHIARQAIELRHDDRAFGLAGQGEGGCQLRPAVEGIRALAGLDLGELLDDGNALGFGETGDRGTLCLDAQA